MSTAVFLNVPSYSHLNPTLPIVRELIRRGEHIFYYTSDEYQNLIEETGATFCSYKGALQFALPASLKVPPLSHIYVLLEVVPRLLENILPELQALQPDYIVYDSVTVWGKYIGQILNVPTISSAASMWFGWQTWLMDPAPYLAYLKEKRKMKKEMTTLHTITKSLQTTYSVKRMFSLWDVLKNAGDMTLLYTSKRFQPFAYTFGKSFKFVGPSLAPRSDTADFPYDQLTKNPIIYISFGTLYNDRVDFYRLCIEAFRDSKWQVIMSIGKSVCLEALGEIPSNFIVRQFVLQLNILQRATLFICHGGTNSVNESLYYHVPLIMIPQVNDQFWAARRAEMLGVGKRLKMEQVTSEKLLQTANEIALNPAFAQRCKEIGQSLHVAGGYLRAVHEIENFKMAKGIQ